MREEEMLDFSGAEPAGYLGSREPLPRGGYIARIQEATVGTSTGGFSQVELTWEVVEGEYLGRRVRDWVVMSPKGVNFIMAYLVALGLRIPGRVAGSVLAKYLAREGRGRLAQITVDVRDRDGRTFNEVVGVAPAVAARVSGSHTAQADVEELEEL